MGSGCSTSTNTAVEEGLLSPPAGPPLPKKQEIVTSNERDNNPVSPDHSSQNISPPKPLPKLNGAALGALRDPMPPPKLKTSEPHKKSPREPIAFELATSNESNSLIKKHPPKKFQKLEEQQAGPALTQEQLDAKQAEAHERRQQLMSKRVQSAKMRTSRSAQARSLRSTSSGEVDEIEGGAIESPETDV